jgi:V/A-type H+-transporting ATPase subunit D
MARVKLTKTELKAQSDALKRFQRFLPMLQLKKQQLQAEIAGISAKADAVTEREKAVRAGLDRWVGLFATNEDIVDGLVKVKNVKTGTANIAGVAIPTFESIDVETKEIDAWATPAWIDDAVAVAKDIMSLQCERAIYIEQRRLVSEELQQTSQRVNLFEKVKIPECKEAIRVIKIAIGDEQTAAVTRGKIAKNRGAAEEDAA